MQRSRLASLIAGGFITVGAIMTAPVALADPPNQTTDNSQSQTAPSTTPPTGTSTERGRPQTPNFKIGRFVIR